MLKLLAFASMALVAASPAAATQSTKTTIMLVTVSSTSAQYVLGDPVTLTFVFKNDGKAVIHMNGWLRPEMLFSLQITDANGDAVAPSGPPRNHMMGITLFPLRAGASITMTSTLSDFGYNIRQPGVYSIQTTVNENLNLWPGDVYGYKSGSIFTVIPKIQGTPRITIQ